jgi:hypothetical protein
MSEYLKACSFLAAKSPNTHIFYYHYSTVISEHMLVLMTSIKISRIQARFVVDASTTTVFRILACVGINISEIKDFPTLETQHTNMFWHWNLQTQTYSGVEVSNYKYIPMLNSIAAGEFWSWQLHLRVFCHCKVHERGKSDRIGIIHFGYQAFRLRTLSEVKKLRDPKVTTQLHQKISTSKYEYAVRYQHH